MRKKRIAGLLAALLLVNNVTTWANTQDKLPSTGISPIVVRHDIAGDSIYPKAQVTFKKATNSSPLEGNSNDKGEADFYKLRLEDSLGGSIDGKQMNKKDLNLSGDSSYTIQVEDHIPEAMAFKNGRLYRVKVIPGHWHTNVNNEQVQAPITSAGEHPQKYFVTDFDTIAREVGEDIQVVWEYIPGATYKLVYIDKDVSTKAGVDGTDGSNPTGVGSQTVIITDQEADIIRMNGVDKVRYTLPNTRAGQKYSAYVLVENINSSFLTDRFVNVGINKDTPKIANATRSVSLDITPIGKGRIELSWKLGAWADNNTLQTTKIYRRQEGEIGNTLIGTINNAELQPRDPERFEHDEPKVKSYYYVEYHFVGGDVLKTKEVPYVPYELREQPLKPQVPEAYSDSVQTQEDFNKRDYLVKDDDVSQENMKTHTFYAKSKSPLQLQLVWDAPKIIDNNVERIEYEMKYDLWVVDKETTLQDENVEPLIKDFSVNEGETNQLILKQDNTTVVGFKTVLNEYINSYGEKKNLISNNTYYIKIVAKRNYSGIYETSQPTIVAITVDRNGDIFKPPVLAKPPLRIQAGGIDKESITLEWLEKWYEITSVNPGSYPDANENFFAKLWNSKVYTGGDASLPPIRFAASEGLTEHLLLTQNELELVRQKVGASTYASNYRDREVILGSDVKYEIKTLLYDDVIRNIKEDITTSSGIQIEKWIYDHEKDTTEGWTDITPGTADHGDGLGWKDYTVGGLRPNTRYIVLVRVYRELETGEKLTQTFPSFVIGTTGTDFENPEATPTVPVLNPDGVTDSSLSVWWTYNSDFKYEIVYSRTGNPDKATAWEFTLSDTVGDANYVANGAKASVKITGLMPDTTYNVWIRAKQKIGDKVSKWSNPVTQTTSTIGVPEAPRGLGPAAYESILEIGKDFKAVGKDYITVEWMRTVADIENDRNPVNKTYSYVVEFADNPEFMDATVVTTGGQAGVGENNSYEILAKNMVWFNGLVSNRPYYVRVKTVLTFKDEETGRVIETESLYTDRVKIMTKTSSDEYDGGDNEYVVTFPNDVEESYSSGVWTYEIVNTNKIISDLINKKVYYYTIRLEKYNNRYDADVRRLKMSKALAETLANRNMELKVITSTATYEIPIRNISYALANYSSTDTVQFEFTKGIDYKLTYLLKPYPEKFIKGEQLEIFIKSKTRQTVAKSLANPMKVKLKLDGIRDYTYKTLSANTYNYDTGNWVKETFTIEEDAGLTYVSFKTAFTGLFALYETQIQQPDSNSSYIMGKLAARYNISGLGSIYYKTDYVYRDQYINLLLGIAQNSSSIDLTEAASTNSLQKAQRAGFYMGQNPGTLTQEEALAGIVKLYELKQGYKIKPSKMTFVNVSPAYSEAVSKAYAIGLIDGITAKNKITFEELCAWIWQVTE